MDRDFTSIQSDIPFHQQRFAFPVACVCDRGDSVFKVVSELLRIVDTQTAHGLLVDACMAGCQRAVDLILDRYPSLVNDSGSFADSNPAVNALYFACMDNHFSLMKHLVSRGANVNDHCIDLLVAAVLYSRNKFTTLQFLVDELHLDISNAVIRLPKLLSEALGYLKDNDKEAVSVFRFLIGHGAPYHPDALTQATSFNMPRTSQFLRDYHFQIGELLTETQAIVQELFNIAIEIRVGDDISKLREIASAMQDMVFIQVSLLQKHAEILLHIATHFHMIARDTRHPVSATSGSSRLQVTLQSLMDRLHQFRFRLSQTLGANADIDDQKA